MDEAQRLPERGQLHCREQLGWYPVGHLRRARAARCFELLQRLSDQHPEPALGKSLGRRVDRRQARLERLSALDDALILGMHDFQAERTAANLPEAAEPRAPRKTRLLRRGEVE